MNQDKLINTIRSTIRNCHYKELRASRGIFQADVYRLNVDGQYVVIKDFSQRPWLSRVLVCRKLISREISVLLRFSESGFLPQFYGCVSDDAFIMEFLQGEHPSRDNAGRWPDAYAHASEFLDLFHREGYVHNDFRRTNVLVQSDGSVKFFDFASAIRRPQRFQWLMFPWIWLLNMMQAADRTSLLKIKPDFTGHPLTAEEHSRLQKKPMWIRAIRYAWSNWINKLILRQFK